MPKWREVEALVLRYIREKGLKDGDPLPSDREIAELFARGTPAGGARGRRPGRGVSLQPVVRAMKDLAARGLVRRGSGRPTTVVEQPTLVDDHFASFTHSAAAHRQQLTTRLLALDCRPPLPGVEAEARAQRALGLKRGESFYLIARLRILDGVPRVIHRAYLNPAQFPPGFLSAYDFTRESLIKAYNAAGYQIHARQTTLRARFPTPDEAAVLNCPGQPVLEAEQLTEAVRVATGEVVPLEYLRACYLNWEYRIAGRPAPSAGAAP